MNAASELAIIVVAAGRGRVPGVELPSNTGGLAGRPLLAHTLDALLRAAPGAMILPVIHKDDIDLYRISSAPFEAHARLARRFMAGNAASQCPPWAGALAEQKIKSKNSSNS